MNPQGFARLNLIQRFAAWLAKVTAVPVGRPDDGLSRVFGTAGTELDKPWQDLQQEFADALDAWRKNPLARRVIGLITAYVVGDGIRLQSDNGPLSRWLAEWWGHPQNRLDFRQGAWCEELSRSGELFITLHTNRADGMSYVRAVPASVIDKVETSGGDYETELSYHETVSIDDPDYDKGGRTWLSPDHPDAQAVSADGSLPPLMMHFAVNRPVGCVRGESDLAPILPWLRRYSRWLEDRVKLNAAMRAFLWIVRVPTRLANQKREQYRKPPEAGSVIVAEKENEEWQAVAPALHAADAQMDGRAIRWMIVAGGPGLGLTDLGEAETANLATASAMGEQRLRFMAARQGYFGFVLASVALVAYNRAVALGKVNRGRPQRLDAINVILPDMSSLDNSSLAEAADGIASALDRLQASGIGGEAYQRLALRTVMRFGGVTLGDELVDRIITESQAAVVNRARPGTG